MSLRPVNWSGNIYTLEIRRHWNAFFAYVPFCMLTATHTSIPLPSGAGYHIQELYNLVGGLRGNFGSVDHFHSFSRNACDHYCDFFVMQRPRSGNAFDVFHSVYGNDRRALQALAEKSKGYCSTQGT